MATRYRFGELTIPHFITYTVVAWADALSRPVYKNVVIDSLRHCIQEKGLLVHAYVIMNNHIHLVASANGEYALENIMRDHKKFTSRQITAAIEAPGESRKDWMLWLFNSAAARNSNNKHYQFWQQDNHPKELRDRAMLSQKIDYIHNNPVRAGLVWQAEQYVYSSAAEYAGLQETTRLPLVLLDQVRLKPVGAISPFPNFPY